MLKVENVSAGYQDVSIIENISFQVKEGELFGILGPNGSGKTTLLKVISGVIPRSEGTIILDNKPLSSYSPKRLAQKVAVLPQMTTHAFDYTVKETVSLGRYPFQKGLFKQWTNQDEEIVQEIMKQTSISHLANKSLHEISGGEKQRVFLAQALAQQPKLLLLDEPTNHLDISHQKNLLDTLKWWSKSCGLTVVSIFHDLNLASLYCDRILLLSNGKVKALDQPNHVVEEEVIKQVYEATIKKQPHPELPRPQVMLSPSEQKEEFLIRKEDINVTKEIISLSTNVPLKTLSSAVIGAGFGWYKTFVNRHVSKDYHCDDVEKEMTQFLIDHQFHPKETVGMMTAAKLEDVAIEEIKEDKLSIVVVVTAGVSNAVDASKSYAHELHFHAGTINTWIFINGSLTDEAYIQAIMTATEAKTKAMHDEKIMDKVTKTIATGTSTDSILVAATQHGENIPYAGTITKLGKMIAKGVYECTIEAIQTYKKRWDIHD